ncbi:hypothetical protein LguiA_002355 [Lonicera macranthoides]
MQFSVLDASSSGERRSGASLLCSSGERGEEKRTAPLRFVSIRHNEEETGQTAERLQHDVRPTEGIERIFAFRWVFDEHFMHYWRVVLNLILWDKNCSRRSKQDTYNFLNIYGLFSIYAKLTCRVYWDQSFTIRSLDKTRKIKFFNANHKAQRIKRLYEKLQGKSFKEKASNEDQSEETNQSIRKLVNSVIE